jgi:tetraacyldisaccharide 4'-kinase
MLAHRFAGPVVTGEHRVAAARLACTRFGLDTIVVDDGFQHRALARDADLVLVPGDMVTSRVLPAGPLREPTTALGRARGILVVDGAATPVTAGVPTFRATLRPSAAVRAAGGVWSTEPLDVVQGERLLAVAGIARPARFVEMLSRLGTGPVETLVFPDHHRYTAGDAARIAAAAGGRLLVTTEKDLVKLAAFPVLQRLRAIRVDLEVEDGDRLLDLLGE